MNPLTRQRDLDRACTWAHDLLEHPNDWAIIQTATTDFKGVVCELGVLAPSGTILFEQIINPQTPILDGARRVHQISDDMITHAPTLEQVWNAFLQAIEGRTALISWNAGYHHTTLLRSTTKYGLPFPSAPWQCAQQHYAAYVGEWSDHHRSYTLKALPSGTGRAIGNARAVLAVLHTMANDRSERGNP